MMMKYKYHDFSECIEEIASLIFFERWETRSYKEKDSDSIYQVDFMDENENILFSKTIIEDREDDSCYFL